MCKKAIFFKGGSVIAWIKVDSGLPKDPKFLDLTARLKVKPADSYWNLTHFWFWVSAYYPDGVLKDVSDFAIAHSSQWTGEPKAFVDAIVESGFVDRTLGQLLVHDWEKWRPEWARSRERREPTRKRPRFDQVSTSSAQEAVVSVVVLSFPVVGETKTWELQEKMLLRLKEIYPNLDVLGECKKALFWLENNPTRRKTARGMSKFIASWLERAQNRPRSGAVKEDDQTIRDRVRQNNERTRSILAGR